MTLEWDPAPLIELGKISCVLNAEDPDRAFRFVTSVENATNAILRNPEGPNEFEPGYRKMRLNSFPYTLIYAIGDDCIWIISIVHQSRHPDYWKRNS